MSLGPAEIAVLIILAVVLFGPEKLPEIARKAARVLRYIRTIANEANGEIKRQLGPEYADFDVRDLNPRTLVTRHLLSDVQPIIADVKRDIAQVNTLGAETSDDLKQAVETAASETPRLEETPVAAESSGATSNGTSGAIVADRTSANEPAGHRSAMNGSATNGMDRTGSDRKGTDRKGTDRKGTGAGRPAAAAPAVGGRSTGVAAVAQVSLPAGGVGVLDEAPESRVPWDHEAT